VSCGPKKTSCDYAVPYRKIKVIFPLLCSDITSPAQLFKYLDWEAIFRDYLALQTSLISCGKKFSATGKRPGDSRA
jgi:hypothetical protein